MELGEVHREGGVVAFCWASLSGRPVLVLAGG